MKIIQLTLGIILVALLGCQETPKNDYADIDKEIEGLKTVGAKKQFLEKIMEDDQKVRDGSGAEIMLEYGKDSKEYRNYMEAQWQQDEINLVKIEKYLNKYGHPKRNELGETAAATPWAVIHHAEGYEDRERNFEYVYGAYLNGDIDDGMMSFYLGRMYQIKKGQRLKMESPYRPEDEINQLIRELNLQEKKANVEQEINP